MNYYPTVLSKLLQITFTHSVGVSKENNTPSLQGPLKQAADEVIAVYTNRTKQIHSDGKMQSNWLLKQVLYTVTTGLYEGNYVSKDNRFGHCKNLSHNTTPCFLHRKYSTLKVKAVCSVENLASSHKHTRSNIPRVPNVNYIMTGNCSAVENVKK
jgi:hypothetical protein